MTDQEAGRGAAATGKKERPEVPHQGGSYVRNKDGSLVREEFTRQPGEPEPATPASVPENADEAPASTTRKRR